MQTEQQRVRTFKQLVRKEILSLQKDLDKAKTGKLKTSNLYASDYSDLINTYNKVLKCKDPFRYDDILWDLDTIVREAIPGKIWSIAQSFEIYKRD